MDLTNPFSTITSIENFLANVMNQYVVTPINSPSTIGISGFIFDVLDDESVMLDSDITDHYVEENYAIQDHIALRPERFTLRGYVGELSDLLSKNAIPVLPQIIESLGLLNSLIPSFTLQADTQYTSLQNVVDSAGQVIRQARNIYDLFSQSSTAATRQQDAYNYFYSMWKSRQLCIVETPYTIFTNMAIEKIQVTQRGETRIVSDFSVTFKKIRTVSSPAISVIPSRQSSFTYEQALNFFKGRDIDYNSLISNNGATQGTGLSGNNGSEINQPSISISDQTYSQITAEEISYITRARDVMFSTFSLPSLTGVAL